MCEIKFQKMAANSRSLFVQIIFNRWEKERRIESDEAIEPGAATLEDDWFENTVVRCQGSEEIRKAAEESLRKVGASKAFRSVSRFKECT
jgi:hypothetical protein